MQETKEKRQRYHTMISHIYYCIVVVIVGMVIANFLSFGAKKNDFGLQGYESMMWGWNNEKGRTINFLDGNQYPEAGEEMSVFYQIPYGLKNQESLVFRTKNTSVRVFLAGSLIYETDMSDGLFNTDAPGKRWNVINYGTDKAGYVIEIRMKMLYGNGKSRIDSIYRGDRAAIILNIIRGKGAQLLGFALMLIIGVLYGFASVVINYNRQEKDLGLHYLSMLSIIIAIWCLIETSILQFFFDNICLLQLIDNMALIVVAIPFFLYFNYMYGIFNYRTFRIIAMVDLVYMAVSTVLHFFQILDYYETLQGMLLAYAALATAFSVFAIYHRKGSCRNANQKKGFLYQDLQVIGMMVLWITIIIDIIYYIFIKTIDSPLYTIFGLLAFLISLGCNNIIHLMELVKQGAKAELISSLAYTDGLTKVGNRTAYMEHLEQIASNVPSEVCTIVMLDMNDLKQVNDLQGHAAGDEYIKKCANMMQEAFESSGTVYRIGGDEFAVILQGEGSMLLYEYAIGKLDAKMRENPEISISYGACFCKDATMDNLHEAEKKADQKMYQSKYLYKHNKNAKVELSEPIC